MSPLLLFYVYILNRWKSSLKKYLKFIHSCAVLQKNPVQLSLSCGHGAKKPSTWSVTVAVFKKPQMGDFGCASGVPACQLSYLPSCFPPKPGVGR